MTTGHFNGLGASHRLYYSVTTSSDRSEIELSTGALKFKRFDDLAKLGGHSSKHCRWIQDLEVPIDIGEAHYISARLIGSGAFVGALSLSKVDQELSYFVESGLWGCGFATEMVDWLRQWVARQNIAKPVVAYVVRENIASVRVLENARFRFAGFFNIRQGMGYRCILAYMGDIY